MSKQWYSDYCANAIWQRKVTNRSQCKRGKMQYLNWKKQCNDVQTIFQNCWGKTKHLETGIRIIALWLLYRFNFIKINEHIDASKYYTNRLSTLCWAVWDNEEMYQNHYQLVCIIIGWNLRNSWYLRRNRQWKYHYLNHLVFAMCVC